MRPGLDRPFLTGAVTYVVVEVAVGDGNPLAGVGDVDETVVVVLAGVEVA